MIHFCLHRIYFISADCYSHA